MTQPPQYPPPPPAYGGGGFGPAPGPKPDSNLVWGILTTLFCCLPFGIVSIVQAAKVDGLWNSGDFAGARAASASARKWAIWAAVSGVIIGLIYVIFFVALANSTGGPGY